MNDEGGRESNDEIIIQSLGKTFTFKKRSFIDILG